MLCAAVYIYTSIDGCLEGLKGAANELTAIIFGAALKLGVTCDIWPTFNGG